MKYVPWKQIGFESPNDDWGGQLIQMGLSVLPIDLKVDLMTNCNIGFFEALGTFINREDLADKHLILLSGALKNDPSAFVRVFAHEAGHFHMGHKNGTHCETDEAEADNVSLCWLKKYADFYGQLSAEDKQGYINLSMGRGDSSHSQ